MAKKRRSEEGPKEVIVRPANEGRWQNMREIIPPKGRPTYVFQAIDSNTYCARTGKSIESIPQEYTNLDSATLFYAKTKARELGVGVDYQIPGQEMRFP